MNPKLLLTYSQTKNLRHKVPYAYVIKKGDQSLFYFGANHSTDPKNKQYKVLDKFWQKFLLKTKNQKRLVLVEGGLGKPEKTKFQGIKKHAENAATIFLANKAKIKVISPDPSLKIQVKELLKKYSKEEIEFFYFAQVLNQWHRLAIPRPNMKIYLQRFLDLDKRELGWKDFAFTLDHMEAIHKKFFKKELNYEDGKFWNNLMNPWKKTKVSRLTAQSGRIRDLYILKEINKYWERGNNIFIVFGFSHAFMQQPALNTLPNKKGI